MAGLRQTDVARATALTQSTISRAERGRQRTFTLEGLATHCAALGLRLSLKVYPEGLPVRDAGQLALLARFRELIPGSYDWHLEVAIGDAGDGRAWDAVLGGPVAIGVDAETRLTDVQALLRRLETKARDSDVDHVVLLVLDSRWNRRVLREYEALLAINLPLSSRAMMSALADGRDPGASGIVLA